MINRRHLETVLKINGLAPSAPNEQIRSVLLSARYSKDEIDTALVVLRENTDTNKTRIDGLHKVFRSDQSLKSSEIAELLGIDVNIETAVTSRANNKSFAVIYYIVIWSLSVAVSLAAILLYMHAQKIGVFHPTSVVKF